VTGPSDDRKPKDPSTWIGKTSDRVAALSDYFLAGANRYTPEALRQAATESGFSPAEIDAAYARAIERQRDEQVAGPIRRRARRIVLASYGLVYAAFVAAFLTVAYRLGAGIIAIVILSLVLLIALSISLAWVGGRHASADRVQGALVTMLAVPFVLLLAVAGVCVAGTTPGSFGLF
jgi:hypothetical protein